MNHIQHSAVSAKVFCWLLLLGLLLFQPFPAGAQAEVEITLTAGDHAADDSELTIGDRVTLTLEIHHPAGSQALIPSLPARWGDFEIVAQTPAQTTTNPDGSLTTRQQISITTFIPGVHTTPSFTVWLQDAQGSIQEATVPSITLVVVSVLQEGDNELRDIKPQAKLKTPFPWLGLLAALLAAGAIWGMWRSRRRRRHKDASEEAPTTAVEPRPPYQIALEELERIQRLKLPEKGRVKEYYTLIDNCLKCYIENQFHLHAMERTTPELQQGLAGTPLPAESAENLLTLFRVGDLVKFARYQPAHEEAAAHMQRAIRTIEQMHPKPQPAETDAR